MAKAKKTGSEDEKKCVTVECVKVWRHDFRQNGNNPRDVVLFGKLSTASTTSVVVWNIRYGFSSFISDS